MDYTHTNYFTLKRETTIVLERRKMKFYFIPHQFFPKSGHRDFTFY